MTGPLIKSTIFHGAILLIAVLGLPFVKTEPLVIAPVSVELVDISDLTQTDQKPPPKAKPIPQPEEPKEIEPPKPPKEELKKPEPPKPEPVKEEAVPLPKPEEKPKAPEKPEPKPKEKPKPKPKPKEEPKQQDLFNSLLKNLTPAEEDQQSRQKQETLDPEDGQSAPIANQISMSEIDALRQQITPCWNVPSGAKYAENLIVTLRLTMRRDMTVQDVRVMNGGFNPDPAFRAAADSAVRAVRNPRCSPFKLPPEKYEQWKTITINFDPSDML